MVKILKYMYQHYFKEAAGIIHAFLKPNNDFTG